ncbi:aldehyde dehydrogenase family protein [Sulfitobacter porphyrae]|uniref:Aldehyde dehydrogenase family protein n=1 Tax=Sulfitobacter porphyrae TaxID=1246864 RepID=A0ABW2B9I4_9RHOB
MNAMIERAGGAAVRIPAARMLINGEWCEGDAGRVIAVHDPATEEKIAEVVAASVTDVDRAVLAAHRAFESRAWQKMRPLDRGRLLEKLALLVERDAEDLARLETLDNGKPYAVSRNVDLKFAIDALRYYGGWSSKMAGEYIQLSPPGTTAAPTAPIRSASRWVLWVGSRPGTSRWGRRCRKWHRPLPLAAPWC